jgi:mono/diheme cytochrome c family protein
MRANTKWILMTAAVAVSVGAFGTEQGWNWTSRATERAIGFLDAASPAVAADNTASSAEAEKAKAMANPYANDLGPADIPKDLLATYPKEHQDAYKNVLLVKCAKCHTASRPLNSQFYEPDGKKEEKTAKIAALKKSNPDMFKNPNVWQVEADIWQRYVRRMMAKPGCEITQAEGKAVWAFLVYDSERRKSGKNADQWKAQRTRLLEDFKKKFPARYKELYGKAGE